MIQSWEILVTDRWSDGQTEESDFIGRCLTDIERPVGEYHRDPYKELIN